ncbi:hypothetical protein C8R47DRAFT_1193929 [Mycena vitilis]|nr:hypothetical protein C8R47DRAFT_1193929 [Mycena vitilis]
MPAYGYLDKRDDEYVESLVDFSTTFLPTSREAPVPSLFETFRGLRFLSVVLHSLLIAIFVALLIISLKEIEHRVIFSLDHQKIVSFAITAITTGFGTIYLAAVVYVTQSLSMRRILQTDQTLTAIHDMTAAWAGIGAAAYHLWYQTRVRSSVIGVLSVFFYLGGVLVLHVATPALFAVQTFTSSRLIGAGTNGLPSWNVDWSNDTNVAAYTQGSLYSLPAVVGSNTSLGLSGGTLYEVLEDNAGVGNVSVRATGFNISCTYPTNQTFESSTAFEGEGPQYFAVQANGIPEGFYMQPAQWGVISAMNRTGNNQPYNQPYSSLAAYGIPQPGPLLLASSVPIIDSNNNHAPITLLPLQATLMHEVVQIVHCVQNLVPQSAVVDAQSHRIIAVEPDIRKTASAWVPLGPEISYPQTGNPFLDGWAQWYLTMPVSSFPFLALDGDKPAIPFVSVGASYLIETLQTHPRLANLTGWYDSPPDSRGNITLHDLENALSVLVASMFWTLGNNPPVYGELITTGPRNGVATASVPYSVLKDALPAPQLLRGNATVSEALTQGRLDLNFIAIVAGLCASVFITLLAALQAISSDSSHKKAEKDDTPLNGAGILHAIWFFRDHDELDTILPQVVHPTIDDLRKAGTVWTKSFRSLQSGPTRGSSIRGAGSAKEIKNHEDVPTDSPTASLRTPSEATNCPSDCSPLASTNPRLRSPGKLRLCSITLHSVLIVAHLALLIVWSKSIEHQMTFSLDRQKTVSFAITAIATAFGTVYLAAIVFVTQTLSTTRLIQTHQTLTAIHDSSAAWSGIGAAISHIWHQTRVRASLIGVLSVFFSLLSVLVLHISTPALFAVQTFNSSCPVIVETQSLPSPSSDWTNETYITEYTWGSLYALPNVVATNASLKVGLNGGTFYDVLEENAGVGNVTVAATGFNISCTYLPNTAEECLHAMPPTQWGVISALQCGSPNLGLPFEQDNYITDPDAFGSGMAGPGPLTLYSTIPIVDSDNQQPPTVDWSLGDGSPSTAQLLQCVQTLVPQTAVVDAQSRQIIAATPDIRKSSSSWAPWDPKLSNLTTGNPFLDGWAQWYLTMPPSNFPVDPSTSPSDAIFGEFLSVGAAYLIQKLQMHPSTVDVSTSATFAETRPSNVTLHDLENALSILVASMFWTLGNVPPQSGVVETDMTMDQTGYSFFRDAIPPPSNRRGNATVTELSVEGRLDLNVIAIVAGFIASIVLMLLAIPTLLPDEGTQRYSTRIDGTGFLHAIWLFRNDPELDALLPQVEHPTTDNLRLVGMVRTRLT